MAASTHHSKLIRVDKTDEAHASDHALVDEVMDDCNPSSTRLTNRKWNVHTTFRRLLADMRCL